MIMTWKDNNNREDNESESSLLRRSKDKIDKRRMGQRSLYKQHRSDVQNKIEYYDMNNKATDTAVYRRGVVVPYQEDHISTESSYKIECCCSKSLLSLAELCGDVGDCGQDLNSINDSSSTRRFVLPPTTMRDDDDNMLSDRDYESECREKYAVPDEEDEFEIGIDGDEYCSDHDESTPTYYNIDDSLSRNTIVSCSSKSKDVLPLNNNEDYRSWDYNVIPTGIPEIESYHHADMMNVQKLRHFSIALVVFTFRIMSRWQFHLEHDSSKGQLILVQDSNTEFMGKLLHEVLIWMYNAKLIHIQAEINNPILGDYHPFVVASSTETSDFDLCFSSDSNSDSSSSSDSDSDSYCYSVDSSKFEDGGNNKNGVINLSGFIVPEYIENFLMSLDQATDLSQDFVNAHIRTELDNYEDDDDDNDGMSEELRNLRCVEKDIGKEFIEIDAQYAVQFFPDKVDSNDVESMYSALATRAVYNVLLTMSSQSSDEEGNETGTTFDVQNTKASAAEIMNRIHKQLPSYTCESTAQNLPQVQQKILNDLFALSQSSSPCDHIFYESESSCEISLGPRASFSSIGCELEHKMTQVDGSDDHSILISIRRDRSFDTNSEDDVFSNWSNLDLDPCGSFEGTGTDFDRKGPEVDLCENVKENQENNCIEITLKDNFEIQGRNRILSPISNRQDNRIVLLSTNGDYLESKLLLLETKGGKSSQDMKKIVSTDGDSCTRRISNENIANDTQSLYTELSHLTIEKPVVENVWSVSPIVNSFSSSSDGILKSRSDMPGMTHAESQHADEDTKTLKLGEYWESLLNHQSFSSRSTATSFYNEMTNISICKDPSGQYSDGNYSECSSIGCRGVKYDEYDPFEAAKNIPEVYSDMENDTSQHTQAYRATQDLVSKNRGVQANSPNVRDHYDQLTLDSISGLCGSIETIYFDGKNTNRFVTLKPSTEGIEIAEAPTSYYSIQNTDVSVRKIVDEQALKKIPNASTEKRQPGKSSWGVKKLRGILGKIKQPTHLMHTIK